MSRYIEYNCSGKEQRLREVKGVTGWEQDYASNESYGIKQFAA